MFTLCVLTSVENFQASCDFIDCEIRFVSNGDDIFTIMEAVHIDAFVSIGDAVEPAHSQLNSLPYFIRCRWYCFDKLGSAEYTCLSECVKHRRTRGVFISDCGEIDIQQNKPTLPLIKSQQFIKLMLAQHANASNLLNAKFFVDIKFMADTLLIWFFQYMFGPVIAQTQRILQESFYYYEKFDKDHVDISQFKFSIEKFILIDEVKPTYKTEQHEICDEKAITATQKSWIQTIIKAKTYNFDIAQAICMQDLDLIQKYCENNTTDGLIRLALDGIYYNSLAFSMLFDNPEITTRLMQSTMPLLFVSQPERKQEDLFLTTLTQPSDKQIRDLKLTYECMWHKSMFETTRLLKDIANIILLFTDSLIVAIL